LKQIGLGAKQWALDHTNSYPMSVSTNLGGTKEWIPTGETFRHFAVMSNELNTPFVLVCPADRTRKRARDLTFQSNSNVSYFVGLDATDDFPQMILFGDRNIFNGVRPANGVVSLATNFVTGWGPGVHNGAGNIALTDGSVQQLASSRMREALANSGDATNRVQLP
jgi:prepilin-type processing-associated H-X9-DG protein